MLQKNACDFKGLAQISKQYIQENNKKNGNHLFSKTKNESREDMVIDLEKAKDKNIETTKQGADSSIQELLEKKILKVYLTLSKKIFQTTKIQKCLKAI